MTETPTAESTEAAQLDTSLLPEHKILVSPLSRRVFQVSKAAKRLAEMMNRRRYLGFQNRPRSPSEHSSESDFFDLVTEAREHQSILTEYVAWLNAIDAALLKTTHKHESTDEVVREIADRLALEMLTLIRTKSDPNAALIKVSAPAASGPVKTAQVPSAKAKPARGSKQSGHVHYLPEMNRDEVETLLGHIEVLRKGLTGEIELYLQATHPDLTVKGEAFLAFMERVRIFTIGISTCIVNAEGDPQILGRLRQELEAFFELDIRDAQINVSMEQGGPMASVKQETQRFMLSLALLSALERASEFPTDRDQWDKLIEPLMDIQE